MRPCRITGLYKDWTYAIKRQITIKELEKWTTRNKEDYDTSQYRGTTNKDQRDTAQRQVTIKEELIWTLVTKTQLKIK